MPSSRTMNNGAFPVLLAEKRRLLEELLEDTERTGRGLSGMGSMEAEAFEERSRVIVTRLVSLDLAIARRSKETLALSDMETVRRLQEEIERLSAELGKAAGRVRASAAALLTRIGAKRASLQAGKKCLDALKPWKGPRSRRFDSLG